MGRKSYRSGGTPPPEEKPVATPARRYTPRTVRTMPAKVDPLDETAYAHVRQDLLRIALLALTLFGLLIVLRVVTTSLGLLP